MANIQGSMYSAYSANLFGHFTNGLTMPGAVYFYICTSQVFDDVVNGKHPITPSQLGSLVPATCQVNTAMDYTTYSAPTLKFSTGQTLSGTGYNTASAVSGAGFSLTWNYTSSFTAHGVVALTSSNYTASAPTAPAQLDSWPNMAIAYWPMYGNGQYMGGITPVYEHLQTNKYRLTVTFPTVEIAKFWTTTNNFKQVQAGFQTTLNWDARESDSTTTRFRFLLMRDDFVYDNLVQTLATSDVRIGGYTEIGTSPARFSLSGLERRSFTDTTATLSASNVYVSPGMYTSVDGTGDGLGSTTPRSYSGTFVNVAASGTANALIFCYYDGVSTYTPLQYIPLGSTVPLDGIDKSVTWTSFFELAATS